MEIHKLKIPSGRINSFKIDNMNIYDMLVHMQHKFITRDNGMCVIDLLKNVDDFYHPCLGTTKQKQTVLNSFRERIERLSNDPDMIKKVNELKKVYPKEILETDKQYFMRLLVTTREYKFAKCEECIQCWLNDEKW